MRGVSGRHLGSKRAGPRASKIWVAWLVFGCCACARAPALAPARMPVDPVARRSSLDELSLGLFEALRAGSLEQSVARGHEVDQLVEPQTRLRIERERAGRLDQGLLGSFRRDWAGARFAGFCAQGARDEPATHGLGLQQPAWVLERLLVVADLGGLRSASWLEGRFVFTDQGWKTLSLTRIEEPRRRHADLELAPCDVESGLH
jgi:hypothetical protein